MNNEKKQRELRESKAQNGLPTSQGSQNDLLDMIGHGNKGKSFSVLDLIASGGKNKQPN